MIGCAFCPRGHELPGSLEQIQSRVEERGFSLDIEKRQWLLEVTYWGELLQTLRFVIIHNRDLAGFSDLCGLEQAKEIWSSLVSSDLYRDFPEFDENNLYRGIVVCSGLMRRGVTVFLVSGGDIQSADLISREFTRLGHKMGRDYFLYPMGEGELICDDFEWDAFLSDLAQSSETPVILGDYYVSLTMIREPILSLLPIDIICQGIAGCLKERSELVLPLFPDTDGVESWFDINNLIDKSGIAPYGWDSIAIERFCPRFTNDGFLSESMHPSRSLRPGARKFWEPVTDPLQQGAGALRFLWEWIKKGNKRDDYCSDLVKNRDALQAVKDGSIFQAAHNEFGRLCRGLNDLYRHRDGLEKF